MSLVSEKKRLGHSKLEKTGNPGPLQTSRVNARGDRVMESKACRDHGVYDAFGTCVFFLLVLRLRLEIVKYEPRHCTFCTGVYRDTVLLVDIGANLFNMASSFICLSGPCRWQYNSRCGYCY